MEHSDVQDAWIRARICEREIGGDRPRRVALAVYGNADLGEDVGLGLGRGEHRGVRRESQTFGELALRVVVAVDDHDRDACLVELRELTYDEQAGVVVTPAPVVEVAGQQ